MKWKAWRCNAGLVQSCEEDSLQMLSMLNCYWLIIQLYISGTFSVSLSVLDGQKTLQNDRWASVMKHEQKGFLCKPFISIFLHKIVTFNAAIYSSINLQVVTVTQKFILLDSWMRPIGFSSKEKKNNNNGTFNFFNFTTI